MPKVKVPPGNDAKMRELILYICHKCACDETFSSTKLNKLLYHSDFGAFRLLGRSITEHEYHAIEFGPSPRRMLPILTELRDINALVVIDNPYFSKMQKRPTAIRTPDLSIFRPEEIALVDAIIEKYQNHNATQISDDSHGIAWQIAYPGGIMPYGFAYISDEPIPAYIAARTKQLAKERGWR